MYEFQMTHFFRFMLLLLCCQANAQLLSPDRYQPSVSVERKDGYFKVDASVLLPISTCQAYALLTDYESLPRYIPGMLDITVERLSDSRVKIHQVGEMQILFFSIQVAMWLEMEETPNRRISFNLIEGDLQAYSGEWRLTEDTAGTILDYHAALTFKQYIPAFLGRPLLERELRKRFEAIAQEARTRKSGGHLVCETHGSIQPSIANLRIGYL